MLTKKTYFERNKRQEIVAIVTKYMFLGIPVYVKKNYNQLHNP